MPQGPASPEFGASEAIVSLVGRDSRKLRSELFRASEPSLPLHSVLWPEASLRLVPRYKHLGGILHCSGSVVPELRTRSALAWQAFRKHRRLVFASPIATHREKSLLFHSLVLSSLLYGAGTWSSQENTCVDKVQGVIVAMTRQMLRPTFSFEAACHLGAAKILATARIPSARVLLHIERLRHLAVVVKVAPKEFWAVLHFGHSWCGLVQDSLDWFGRTLELAGQGQPSLSKWDQTLGVLLDRPRERKKWTRVAQRAALLAELWEAEVQNFHGLLLRSLKAKGATTDDLADDETSTEEICAICQRRFHDLRCWSHHAFKRHGRIKESRLVAQGSQCQVCLRHFANTFRLSNHLEHSRACLAALVQHGQFIAAVPGRGSKGFNDGRDSQLPAVTASGPQCQWSGAGYIPESDRAEPSILDGLTEIFVQPTAFADFDALVSAARRAFLGACLQQTRLRATAVAWKQLLEEELGRAEEVPALWASWHTRLADWLLQVDFAAWLVPDVTDHERPTPSFKDCSLLLPWLSFDPCVLPVCCEVLDLGLRVIGAERALFGRKLHPDVHFLSHDLCMRTSSHLDFSSWISESPPRVIGFSVLGLLASLSVPVPLRHYKKLAPQLSRLRLFADLVRGIFYLWTHGRPAFLVSAPVDCPGLVAVKKTALVTSHQGDIEILSNFQGPIPFTLGFTL